MDSVIRGLFVYLFVLLVFRIAGKRALSNISTFDLVLMLIISETLQQALIDNDNSMTNAALLVLTLVGIDIGMSILKRQFPRLEQIMDSSPTVLIKGGRLQHQALDMERVDEEDLVSAAREHEGISRLDEIDYAVLEKGGNITVIPKRSK